LSRRHSGSNANWDATAQRACRSERLKVIDIDTLLFGKVLIDAPKGTIPHPRMLERRFVLERSSRLLRRRARVAPAIQGGRGDALLARF
jgi:7,8-dihydro-6-hydroxymethylpterin-pyrophosphokinase